MTEKRQKIFNILTHTLTFGLGILAFYLTQQISSYLNRPIFNVEPKSIVIYEDFDGRWNIDLNVRITNSGNNRGIIKLEHFSLLFDSLSDRPYEFNIDSIFSIDSKFSLTKIISTKFPSVFKSMEFGRIPNIVKMNIFINDIINEQELNFSIDSSKVFYRTLFESGKREPKYMSGVEIDSAENKIRFVTKPFYIEYKGEKYLNKVYPRNVDLQYKIVDDKIDIRYTQKIGESNLADTAITTDDVILFPHPYLKDKILYPNKMVLAFNIERKEKGKIIYEDYNVEVHSSYRNYLYILK